MKPLHEILRPDHVVLSLRVESFAEAIDQLMRLLKGDERVLNPGDFREAVWAREGEGGTILDAGLAIPHARTEAVNTLVGAYARLDKPLQTADMKAIEFVFLFGLPAALAPEYLRLLGGLARIYRDAVRREALRQSTTPDTFLSTLEGHLAEV